MRLLMVLLVSMALAGCASSAAAPPSGYVNVRWQVASFEETNAACNAGTAKIYRKAVWGCARRSFDECTIYTTDAVTDPRQPNTLGHELRHCFVGEFH